MMCPSIDMFWWCGMVKSQLATISFCSGHLLRFAVCGAPKRRFRAYQPAVTRDANDTGVRKARKAQMQRDEAVG